MRFTARALQAVAPPATGRGEVFDETLPGFGVRISASGRRTWFVMYRCEGSLERLTLGRAGPAGLSLADARAAAREALATVAKGGNPAEAKRRGRKTETFAELAERYLAEHAKPNKKSWRRDEEILNRDVLPAIGRMKANKVGRADVRELLRAVVARGAPVLANRTLEVVRQTFNWALREEIGDIAVNPCLRMPRPGGDETSRERVLSDAEIALFWERLDGAGMSQGTKVALRLVLATGQRKGEVAAARWEEIDESAKVWTIPAERSKNGLAHRVPLSRLALSLFDEVRELADVCRDRSSGSVCRDPGANPRAIGTTDEAHGARGARTGFVFPSLVGVRPVAAGALNNALYRTRGCFGIGRFTPHDLRRTAATQMASMGISRLIIGKVLNHVEPGVTSIYDRHGYDVEKRAALDAWAGRLSAILSPRAIGTTVEAHGARGRDLRTARDRGRAREVIRHPGI
jgi:integrase